MSEEEKAISELKSLYVHSENITYEQKFAIATALNLIKKLQKENRKYIVKLTDEEYRNLVDIIRKKVKQEIKQEIKDKIKELVNTKGDFATYIATSEKIKVLEELLEEIK